MKATTVPELLFVVKKLGGGILKEFNKTTLSARMQFDKDAFAAWKQRKEPLAYTKKRFNEVTALAMEKYLKAIEPYVKQAVAKWLAINLK